VAGLPAGAATWTLVGLGLAAAVTAGVTLVLEHCGLLGAEGAAAAFAEFATDDGALGGRQSRKKYEYKDVPVIFMHHAEDTHGTATDDGADLHDVGDAEDGRGHECVTTEFSDDGGFGGWQMGAMSLPSSARHSMALDSSPVTGRSGLGTSGEAVSIAHVLSRSNVFSRSQNPSARAL